MRPSLIVVRAGDSSLHPTWDDGTRREYDVLVSYYGSSDGRYSEEADHYHAWRGSCWTGNADVCRSFGQLLRRYAHVAFCDDDVYAPTSSWNLLFRVCRDFSLDLASPAFTGFISDELRPIPGLVLRYSDVLEIICPVFSRRSLPVVSPFFGENGSGWGQNSLWAKLCPRESYGTAVVDCAPVEHTRDFGRGDIYSGLAAAGISPYDEAMDLYLKFGLGYRTPRFFGAVRQPVDSSPSVYLPTWQSRPPASSSSTATALSSASQGAAAPTTSGFPAEASRRGRTPVWLLPESSARRRR